MIQIFGVREVEGKLVEVFTDKHWCPSSVQHLFSNLDDILAVIPDSERYDLFFTVHHVEPGSERAFTIADSIIFEITNLTNFDGSLSQATRVLAVVSELTNVGVDQMAVAQVEREALMVAVTLPNKERFTTELQVAEVELQYKELCRDLELSLNRDGLTAARVNKKAWGVGALMRVPGTASLTNGGVLHRKGGAWKKQKDSSAKLSIVGNHSKQV